MTPSVTPHLPRRSLLGLAASTALPALLGACATPAPTTVSLPRTRQHDLRTAAGRSYRLFIAEPDGAAPAGGWPVLFLLDGNATFPVANTLMRSFAQRGSPGVVLAGIGHPGDQPFDEAGRLQDFAPERGADAFLDMIANDIRPLLPAAASSERTQQSVFGHSLGGLLVLHALFTRPLAFGNHYAASPSIWWNERAILQTRDRWLATSARPGARLAVTVGSMEQSSTDPKRDAIVRQRRQVDAARELCASLQDAPGLQVSFAELPGESHGSALVPALQRALVALQRPA